MERSGSEILADIKGSSFVMVAHGVLDILNGDFTIRFQEKRHRSICLTQYIRQKLIATVGKHIKIAPYTSLTITTGAKIKRSVCTGKTEIFVYPLEITFLTRKRDNIRRIHTIFLVIHIKLMDAALIGMGRNAVIRHTDSHPDSSTHTGSFTDHLHNPYLIRIGDGKRLATAVISIFLYQLRHYFNGFTGSTRTLQP